MYRHLLAAGLILYASNAFAKTGGVKVQVRLAAPDALEVSYALPPGCGKLSFKKTEPGSDKIRARWHALDACGAASGDSLTAGNCKALVFRVPVTSDKITGYPGSFPTGQAIYAHMSNYAVGGECGPVHYQFASTGSILTGLALHRRQAASNEDAPALLFPASAPVTGKDLDYFDPALSAAAVAQIRERVDGTAADLRKAMPLAVFKRPVIAATRASEPGGPNIGGNAGDILLLSFFNWPDAPAPEQQRLMGKLVTHEMSHRFQLRDAVDAYPDARLIHEGAAEFLRWWVSLRRGWLTPREAAAELDEALFTCMLATGQRSWRELSQAEIGGNRLEYTCGLPAYVYALAGRQGSGGAIARIDAFYSQLRAGAHPEFSRAMECGGKACMPAILPAILDQPGPMRAQWASVLESRGLARPLAPNQPQVDAMMLQALTQLTREDCQGKRSMTPTPSSVLIDTLPACATVRRDIEVVQVEGMPVFGGPLALPAMVDACAGRHAIALGLKDGQALSVPCRVRYQPATHMVAADIGKIMEALAAE